MDQGDRLLGLLEQLYAAPGTMEGWHTFLNNLQRTVDGSGANLICHDVRSLKGTVIAFVGSDADGARLCQQHWSAYDPWAHSPKQSLIGQGSVGVGDELIEHSTFTRTAFYADFARHYGFVRLIGGVIEKGPAGASVISVSRSERRKPFGRDEVVLFDALVPHLQRALQFHRRLSSVEVAVEDFASILDRSSCAVFLLNSTSRLMFANRAASRLASALDGLAIEQGELRAAGAADRTRLRALLTGAVSTSNGEGLAAGGALAVRRPSGRRPLQVLVCPVSRHHASFPGFPRAAAIVFVTDPEQVAVLDEDTLRTLFALTPAEAKLTCLLARGSSLNDAGTQLGLRRETARSRLKMIFEKTHTHRQAELVRLVVDAAPHV